MEKVSAQRGFPGRATSLGLCVRRAQGGEVFACVSAGQGRALAFSLPQRQRAVKAALRTLKCTSLRITVSAKNFSYLGLPPSCLHVALGAMLRAQVLFLCSCSIPVTSHAVTLYSSA